MKKLFFVIIAAIMIVACKKETAADTTTTSTERNINYPAAYVVNGESGTISVIRLSDNTLTDSIELKNSNGSMVMWPHHIYSHETHLTIGVPGMDLSLGHTGGMAGMKGRFVVMDATKGTTLKNVELPMMNHNALYSPDGTEIWTTQMDSMGQVLVYDALTFALKTSIDVGEDPAEITFSPDGSKAYVCNGGSNSVSVINPATKSVIATLNVGVGPVGAWPSSTGKMFVDNETSGNLSIISIAGNNVLGTINLGFMPGYAAYHAGTGELWVSNPMEGKVVYFEDMGGNIWMKHGEFSTGAGAHAIAFNGNVAYVTNQSANTVSVVNVTGHTISKTIGVGKKPNGVAIKN